MRSRWWNEVIYDEEFCIEEEDTEKYWGIINSDLSILRVWISLFDNDSFMIKVRSNNIFYCDCPFHKSTSFPLCINENAKAFFCYGCGKGGTIVSLMSEYFDITNEEVVNILYAYINNNTNSLKQSELTILNKIFSNYDSKKVDRYFTESEAKTIYLNNRINRYIKQNGFTDDSIKKMSKRLCCSQYYIREMQKNNQY